jgi:hypothetical protein
VIKSGPRKGDRFILDVTVVISGVGNNNCGVVIYVLYGVKNGDI